MRSVDQFLGRTALHAGQADVETRGDAVGLANLAEVDTGVDRQVGRHRDLLHSGDGLDCADEAGGITGGEQLLRVGPGAGSSRRRQLDVQAAVIGAGSAVTAAGGVGLGGVKDFVEFCGHGSSFWSGSEVSGVEALSQPLHLTG